MKSHTRMSNRITLSVVLLALLATVRVFAAGGVESDKHHEDSHHDTDHIEESIPDIDPVGLKAGEKLAIVASTSIVGDVVSRIGSEAINLTTLMPIGQNPHSYEPTPSALASVERAHVVFVNGFGLEEALLEALESTARGPVVAVSTGIEPYEPDDDHDAHEHEDDDDDGDHEDDDHEGHDHGPVDPHVWFDPTNVMVWTENITEVLAAADPANEEGYRARGNAYLEELEELDAWIRTRVAEIPEERRRLVTDHGMFGYFAEEYGFEVIATILPGTSTSSEASARRVAEIVETLKDEGVTTIFVGSTAGRGLKSVAEAITEELGRTVRIVDMLTGSLAPAGTAGDTYLGYMRYNVERVFEGVNQP